MAWNLTSPGDVRALLARYGIVPRKSLGQHFLVAAPVLDKIVDALAPGAADTVVEIGPGLGVLTQRLAATGASIIAVELDGRLLPVLRETLAPYRNVGVVHGDALQVDFNSLVAAHGGKTPYKVAGNLPYNITGPLVARLLREPCSVERLVFMVQKEVADRFVAQPGTREYGSLTILVQYRTHCRVVAGVSRRCFYPPPEVASAVVQMVVREEPPAPVLDERLFWSVVRAAFAQRRKTLKNALRAQMGVDTRCCERVLAQVGIDPQRRGETLSIGEFAALTNALVRAAGGKDDV